MDDQDKITINGVEYIRADKVPQDDEGRVLAPLKDGMEYCMVRTYSAGVFAGYIERREGKEVTLRNARRIWFWAGAASLSELATRGTSAPQACKFPCEVDSVTLTEVIEIIPITEMAKESIQGVPEWRKN